MYRMQAHQLLYAKEQKDPERASGIEKILQILQEACFAQRNEVEWARRIMVVLRSPKPLA